ncbi:C10 family peptidase [Mucilaginibacter ginkgonis]|uniref:C10 family peptidase n=1 Tax=Mucilaginibacter ginkgonis TaxID=2682091 RepID=A0A6I4I0V6_9SPHI|nr:C10 family peptidase [Mucilaginibacter ginkgonis]QQL51204.1 C10 family peptidase [Mucilaginibacter ginkgonis]
MKKSILLPTITTAIVFTTYTFAATALIDLPKHSFPKQDSIFLKTHWQQMGGFEQETPDHLRLGCWSTAFAQIVYYHRLKPFGHVSYTSSHGYVINEDIDSSKIDLAKLSMQIDKVTPTANIDALAKYNYYAALAVNKDFGTDNYMHKLASSGLLEQHYKIRVSRYISWNHILPYSSGKLERIVMQEISSKRPLFLHFANLKDFGHSVVIDGYKQINDRFFVHLNQGQGGPQDGWYDFDEDLLHKGDRNLRVIYTIRPMPKSQLH